MTTIIHVAGIPLDESEQRCIRCHKVLIDRKNEMSLDGIGSRWYAPGAFIGDLYRSGFYGPEKIASVLMAHDASEADEQKCVPELEVEEMLCA